MPVRIESRLIRPKFSQLQTTFVTMLRNRITRSRRVFGSFFCRPGSPKRYQCVYPVGRSIEQIMFSRLAIAARVFIGKHG